MSDCFEYPLSIEIMEGVCVALLVALAFVVLYGRKSKKRLAIELERRVHERTIELKKYVESLQRSQAEKNFLLDGISKRINASIATMKGLSAIARTYDDIPADFVKNVDVATDTMADILQQIAKEKNFNNK